MAPVLYKPQLAPTTGGHKNGTSNYTKAEVMNMLNCMRKFLPIGPDQWEHVAQLHAENYPHSERNVDSIRRKYQKLHWKSIPTGDLNIADDIALAKEIKYLIGQKADLGDGEEEFDLEQGYTVDDENTSCNDSDNTPFGNATTTTTQFLPFVSLPSSPLPLESNSLPLLSKRAKKKRSYKKKVTLDNVIAALHLGFGQQERNAVRARQERQETMNSILSLARAYFSSCNNNNNNSGRNDSNTKRTCDETNNPMVE
eukprot:jgi/Psemu1/144/gm1.144_g